MPVQNVASPPSTVVTEVPGRYSPVFFVDKRSPSTITTSTATTAQLAQLFRAEAANTDFQTPTTPVEELGTNLNVGEYDDLPEVKVNLSIYDVGTPAMSLICAKATPTGTTTFGFQDLAAAKCDLIRQLADPNGNIFTSSYAGDLVVSDWGLALKAKGAAMETYAFQGFNTLNFRGFQIAKAYVAQAADVTAGFIDLSSGFFGASEAPQVLPVNTPIGYWQQTGRLNFLKVERYRAGLGWIRFPESPTSSPPVGQCFWAPIVKHLSFNQTVTANKDLQTGDLIIVTYNSYASNVTGFNAIDLTTLDTSDPVAVPTRLTPFTISANNIPRGQSWDLKMTLKRDRAEGIGDTDGVWGPPAAPAVSLSLDVKKTDFSLNAIMQTGSPVGSDTGGTGAVAGDYFDPNQMTRNQLAAAVPTAVQIFDPRSAGVVLATVTSPTSVYKQYQLDGNAKNPMTEKYTGSDRVGNITVAFTH